MEVTIAFLEGVEESIEVIIEEESPKENTEMIANDGEQHNIIEEAVLGGMESTVESIVVVEEEEFNENTDVFVETEEEDTNVQESEVENDINTYTTLEVLLPSSSDKQTSRRSTPSRPLCEADINLYLAQEAQQQDIEQTVCSAIEQEAMVEEDEEDEDKENIEQQQYQEEEETVVVPMLQVKSIKSSSTSSGQAVKRLSSLYLPTKSTLARVAHETSTTTMRPHTSNTNPFSGSQSLKSAMSNTGRSVASAASSASMGHTNHVRSTVYKSPETRGMCKSSHPKHHNKGIKKPVQAHAAIAVRRGPTIPVTPHFRSDARSKMHHKERPLTTEERELAAIEIARKMEELRMKKTKKVFLLAKNRPVNNGTVMVKSTKELTVPTTPVSYLNRRKGQKVCSLAAAAGSSLGHGDAKAQGLASALQGIDFHNKKPTLPEPFQFATDARIKAPAGGAQDTAVVAAAEAATKWEHDPRSHGAPKYTNRRTIACPPRLLTDMRAKTDYRPKILSSEEKEGEEFDAMQLKAFKAKPVDKRIFDSMGELGVPKVAAKPVTETAPFELRIDKRAAIRPMTDAADGPASALDTPSTFKARPVPSTTHVPETVINTDAQPLQLTVPKSPKLSGGARASAAKVQKPHHSVVEQEKRAAAIAASSLPPPVTMQLTEPKEFHFRVDSRGAVYQAQLAQQLRMEQEREEALRSVKAVPVPTQLLAKPFQPTPSDKQLTEFQEFHLRSTELHQAEVQVLEQDKKKSEQEAAELAQFHARPVPKTTYEKDFEVTVEERAPLVPIDIAFESDQRAIKRREFDEMIAQKMAQLEEQKELAARRKLEMENRRIKEMRSKPVEEGGMSFKATPVITKDLYPSKCVKSTPLTEPKSPAFSAIRHRASSVGTTAGQSEELKSALQAM